MGGQGYPDGVSMATPFYGRPICGIEEIDHLPAFRAEININRDKIRSGFAVQVQRNKDFAGV